MVAWSNTASADRDGQKKQCTKLRGNGAIDSVAKHHKNNQPAAANGEEHIKDLTEESQEMLTPFAFWQSYEC